MTRRDGAATAARDVSAPIRLAGGELGGLGHVCGLFSGEAESYAVLTPFIVDGLERGERAVHLLGPAERASHLERLTSAGLDVDAALATGQLEVQTWEAGYLRGGRFDRTGTLLFLQKTLAEGRSRGFAATRLIGFMDWALEEVAGVGDVVAYETDVDLFLRGTPDHVVCAYDLSRHSAALVVQLQAAHPLVIVGARLLATAGAAVAPRDRILDAASQHFSSQRVGPTGVDALIESAGVAKATFYRHFPSKNDLIVAWLSDSRTRWLERVRRRAEEIARGSDEAVPAFFDAVAEWLEAEGYRGCPYLNTAVELVDSRHPAQPVINDYLSEVRTHLGNVLRSIDQPDPDRLAAQLQTLLAGAIALSVARRSAAPVRDAREAAIKLLAIKR